MLKKEIRERLEGARQRGWVLEPDAKAILRDKGLPVPQFAWTKSPEEAVAKAREIGYPVVAKVVSSRILHKSDVGGVVVDIWSDDELRMVYSRLTRLDGFDGVLVEEMAWGDVELIMGGTIDYQFGPVILLGLGGTSVEVYKDTVLRLAPLRSEDVHCMVKQLKARALLEGHRGGEPIDLDELTRVLMLFSDLVMEMEGWIESVDLNPVVWKGSQCTVADARIILAKSA